MIKALTKLTRFSFIAFLTVSLSAEYKLGRDYVLVDNPLPVKKDGIVEVTESFGTAVHTVIHLSLQLIVGKKI